MAISAEWRDNRAYCRQCGEYLRAFAVPAVTQAGLQIHMHQSLRMGSNAHGVVFHVSKKRLTQETVGKSALRHKPASIALTVVPGGDDLREYRPWQGDGVWVKCTHCGRPNHVLLPIDPPRYKILPTTV
jgi:hypothetical protein